MIREVMVPLWNKSNPKRQKIPPWDIKNACNEEAGKADPKRNKETA